MREGADLTPARVLTIAGSDSSGGAGIQADLKTLFALGVHGCCAVTAVTAQDSLGVHGSQIVPPAVVRAQIRAVLDDLGADAVKTGMLGSAETVRAVADELAGYLGPIVVDPVGIASSGQRLLDADAVGVLVDRLLPMATVVTPNVDEVAMLTGLVVHEEADLDAAAAAVLALGPRWVLIKGGHLAGAAVDLLTDGSERHLLRAERLVQPHTHGTGCTLASALAAGLAKGQDVPVAARAAKDFTTRAILHGFPLGAGTGPVWQGG